MPVNISTVNTLGTKCTIPADLTWVTLFLNTLLSGVPRSLAFWSLIVVLHRHESCYESWKVGFRKKLEFVLLGSILARHFWLKWSKSHNENLRQECNRDFSERDSNKKHVKRFMQNPKRRDSFHSSLWNTITWTTKTTFESVLWLDLFSGL